MGLLKPEQFQNFYNQEQINKRGNCKGNNKYKNYAENIFEQGVNSP